MSPLPDQLPASLRSGNASGAPPYPHNLSGRPQAGSAGRPYLIAAKKSRAAWTPFVPLPKESEDARITGSTRSLDRRLLALNLGGRIAPQKVRPEDLPTSRSGSKAASQPGSQIA